MIEGYRIRKDQSDTYAPPAHSATHTSMHPQHQASMLSVVFANPIRKCQNLPADWGLATEQSYEILYGLLFGVPEAIYLDPLHAHIHLR